MMFGIDYSKKLDVQEETILLEMIPISTITNIKTTTNDIALAKKKDLVSKDDAKKDNKTVMKDSKFDNENVSQKKVEPKVEEKPQEKKVEKPEPKKEEKKAEPNEQIKKDESKASDNREKVPTKDIKKEPEVKKEKVEKPQEKKIEKTEQKKEEKKVEPKKEVSKTNEKKQDKDKKKKPESNDELANSVLKSLEEGGKKSSKNKNKEKQKSLNDIMENAIKGDTTTDYDQSGDLSISEIAAIRSQISQAWRVTGFSGGKDNKNMSVTVKIKVDSNGEVTDIKVNDRAVPVGIDRQVYNVFIDSVIRAIKGASPLQNLPEDKYNTWNEMELRFDSSGMIY
jgi:hypothetical protein